MKGKKHIGLTVLIILVALLIGSSVSYCVYAEKYKDIFIEGTFINGIDVGGMKVSEVEDVIKNRVEDYDLTLIFKDGQTEVLSKDDIGFTYVSDRSVSRLLSEQNPYEWIKGRFGSSNSYTVLEAYTYDQDLLEEAMLALPEFSGKNTVKAQNAHMKISAANEITIVPEIDGNELRKDVVLEALKEAVAEGKTRVDVSEIENAYITAELRSDDTDLVSQVKDMNAYLNIKITYDLYDNSTVILDRTEILDWLVAKDNNPEYYCLDKDTVRKKCSDFISKMAQKYDKVYDSFSFHSTNRGDVTIPTEKRGYLIDEAGESAKLYEMIVGKNSGEREPLYKLQKKPYSDLKDGAYVEVDIQNQHVYFYRNGDCVLDSTCVTGKQTDPSRRTPTGYFSVIEKDTSRTLQGEINPSTGKPSYESFVNYWIRFYEGYGLHDASWRSNFGGDIYISSGSHGCVNLPYNVAKSLYSMVEYGTPVVVI